ncbi:uncharacterized protein HMPREF1541_07320 [Cyphellophora europaea CBS 101466]|uniref:Uncharacterized protein n=1 Tax=Cyphellophora europaea (strain CBS 101466) TaxID=1220924 RepID=W2RMI7_CYPE1|nr:uncharacterized protein HMPREF1541_07320 [Cyphellophora europaea CBS 101466]ETN37697.1 hypothetical protein HMPREF1541_07320 [Cyphellophora europaea CBS 101466]
MVYSVARLNKTLRIFRKAKEREAGQRDDDNNNNIELLLRGKRPLRLAHVQHGKSGCLTRGEQALGADDGDGDDDEAYDPDGKPVKKKSLDGGAKIKKGLKRKADGPAEAKPAKSPKTTGTAVLSKEERAVDRTAYLTMVLTSERARSSLALQARKHCNNVRDLVFEHFDKSGEHFNTRTYFETLDEACAQIDNEGGRALRNRKVVAIDNKCRRCRFAKKRCECYKLLIRQPQDDDDLDRPRKRIREPSVAPIVPSKAICRNSSNAPRSSPSVKGKERAMSPSPPPALPTPPATSSQCSSISSRPRSSFSLSKASGFTDDTLNKPCQSPWNQNLDQEDKGPKSRLITNARDERGSSHAHPITLEDDDDEHGKEITLQTRWSHPIDFRYTKGGCKFCHDFRYGVFGGIQRLVQVIRDPTSKTIQYIEVETYGQDQPEQTKMCPRCAFKRLYIIDCPGHAFRRLDMSGLDNSAYIKQVTNQTGPPQKDPMRTMCSLCPLPAHLQCCASQKYNQLRQEISQPNKDGCGLCLCQNCWTMLRRIGGRTLRKERIEGYIEQKNKERDVRQQFMLRADAEFLFSESLLQKAYPCE